MLLLLAGISAVSLYATLQVGAAMDGWRYDRVAVGAGEWLRLLGAHFVHGSLTHWALNMAGLSLIVAIFPDGLRVRRLVVILPPLALSVTGGLFFLNPAVSWYVGLSGVLHGVLVFGAVRELRGAPVTSLLILDAASAKLAYEQLVGSATATVALIGLPVIVDAHLYGAVAGAAGGLMCWRGGCRRLRDRVVRLTRSSPAW